MLLYGPRLVQIDLMAGVTILGSGIFVVASLVRFRVQAEVVRMLVFTLLCLLLVGTTNLFFHDYNDTNLATFFIKAFLYIAAVALAVEWATKLRLSIWSVLSFIVIATFLNAMSVFTFFLSADLAEYASRYLDYTRQLGWLENRHRTFDLSLGGGSGGSFTFSAVFVLGLFLYAREKSSALAIVLACIFFSTALMGRIGILFNCIAILMYLVSCKRELKVMWKISPRAIFLFFMVFIPSIFMVRFLIGHSSEWSVWVIELASGTRGRTFQTIFGQMYFLPNDALEILFGTGNLGRSENAPYISSDVGYVRSIFGFGLIVTLILYLAPLAYFWTQFYNSKNNLFIIPLTVWIMLILMNFKEFHYLNRGTFVLIVMVTLLAARKRQSGIFN